MIKVSNVINYSGKFILLTLLAFTCGNKTENNSKDGGWVKTIGSLYFDECYDISIDKDNNIYFAGVFSHKIEDYTLQSNGALDIIIGKLFPSGEVAWVKRFGGKEDDEAYNIITTESAVYVAGYFSGELEFAGKKYISQGAGDAVLLKLSATGEELGIQVFGSTGHDEAITLQVNNKNEILVAGYFENELVEFPGVKSNGGTDGFVAKISESNKVELLKNFGGTGNDKLFCNSLTKSGTILLGGEMFVDSIQKEDNLLLELDEQLNTVSSHTFGSKAYDQVNSIGLLNEDIIVSGEYRNGDWSFGKVQKQLPYRNFSDAYIASLTKSTKELNWIETISSPKHEWAKGMCIENNRLFISSEFNDSAYVGFENNIMLRSKGLYDVYLAELNAQGKLINKLLIVGKGEEGINKILIKNNNLYGCGWSYDTVNFKNTTAISKGEGDVYIWKTDLNNLFN